jgi:hypothetical protein|tara:strand:- start:162 stop:362 length:201 start_codon:yes stop_codon:yes gene_type:complete
MIKLIRLAIKYKAVLPAAIALVQEIEKSISDDGSISREERSKLMKRFWVVVKTVQYPDKIQATTIK